MLIQKQSKVILHRNLCVLANYKVGNRQAEMIFQILAKIVHLLRKKKEEIYFLKALLLNYYPQVSLLLLKSELSIDIEIDQLPF